jgi:hypothetical protein
MRVYALRYLRTLNITLRPLTFRALWRWRINRQPNLVEDAHRLAQRGFEDPEVKPRHAAAWRMERALRLVVAGPVAEQNGDQQLIHPLVPEPR